MSNIKYLFYSFLLLALSSANANAQAMSCQPIDLKVDLAKNELTGKLNTVKIAADERLSGKLSTSIIGPNGYFKGGTSDTEFKNLASGEYVVVVTGRREDDNYCPTQKKIIID